MKEKKQGPQPNEAESRCAIEGQTRLNKPTACEGKDIIKTLPLQQKRTFYHLLNAKRPQSAADIVRALGQCDPRTHIKALRDKGVEIADIWCYCKENGRYKRYYIKNPLTA